MYAISNHTTFLSPKIFLCFFSRLLFVSFQRRMVSILGHFFHSALILANCDGFVSFMSTWENSCLTDYNIHITFNNGGPKKLIHNE